MRRIAQGVGGARLGERERRRLTRVEVEERAELLEELLEDLRLLPLVVIKLRERLEPEEAGAGREVCGRVLSPRRAQVRGGALSRGDHVLELRLTHHALVAQVDARLLARRLLAHHLLDRPRRGGAPRERLAVLSGVGRGEWRAGSERDTRLDRIPSSPLEGTHADAACVINAKRLHRKFDTIVELPPAPFLFEHL